MAVREGLLPGVSEEGVLDPSLKGKEAAMERAGHGALQVEGTGRASALGFQRQEAGQQSVLSVGQ